MTNLETNIYCTNPKCNTLNSLNNQFCSQCNTPIIKRYLWTLGETPQLHSINSLIDDRYLVQENKVLLDTKPGILPNFPNDIPAELNSYLKLLPYRLHLPQIYGYIDKKEPIWLLEYSSISLNKNGELSNPKLFPSLQEVWGEISPLQQLNLLWQMIQLWQPLSSHKVVSSLLNDNLLRVNGSLIQLLELQPDFNDSSSLQRLGDLWLKLSENCHKNIDSFVKNLAVSILRKIITQPEKILNILDQAIYKYSQESFNYQYKIITATHTGKKRGQNEDACYPSPKIFKKVSEGIDSLAIVCDGLGGQDSGEIASKLAIKIISEELINSPKAEAINEENNEIFNPLMNGEKIINALHKANDEINEKNNQENRKKLARMGTTAVMSLALKHEIYLGYVGDSRIYWINDQNCYQVTVDDDLASREVRLGYSCYREAIKYPQNGALLQALGTSDSQNLHPHVQRFILDQNSVFLLCSDGLSDFDRVEEYWQSEILPILNGEIDLAKAAKNLLNIGIKKNGHDNVTLALVYCQIEPKENSSENSLSWDDIKQIIPDLPLISDILLEEIKPQKKLFNPSNKSTNLVQLSLLSLIIISFGILIFMQWESIKNYFNPSQKSSQLHLII